MPQDLRCFPASLLKTACGFHKLGVIAGPRLVLLLVEDVPLDRVVQQSRVNRHRARAPAMLALGQQHSLAGDPSQEAVECCSWSLREMDQIHP